MEEVRHRIRETGGHAHRRRAAALAVAALACLSLACTGGNAVRDDFIREVLQKRAKHQPVATREAILEGVTRAEVRTAVDALLILSIIEEESHFRPRARSKRGALGLMQVRPATGRDVCKRNRISWDGDSTLYDPESNVLIGATYLVELETRFGSLDLALTAYNEGPTRAVRAAKRGRKPSSRYAGRVLRRYDALRKMAEADPEG